MQTVETHLRNPLTGETTMARTYQYRMAGVLWRLRIGPGRLGTIHGASIVLVRQETGFPWRARHQRTGQEWAGTTIIGLVRQIWCDLHGETFAVDEASPADGDYQQCEDCHPAAVSP
jgi:hypothetical protein